MGAVPLMPTGGLKDQSIVSVALERWDVVWRNRHHVVSGLARQNKALFVTAPFYVRDVLKDLRSRNRFPTGLSKINNNLHCYVPPRWLPYNYRFPRLDQWINEQRIARLRNLIKRLGMKNPILYLWHPEFVDMVGRLNESLVVYHCYDEYTSFTDCVGSELELLKNQEERLLSKADIVFASSQDLADRKRAFNPNTHVVRNAVDYEVFASARNSETRVPGDMKVIQSPVMGCVAATGHYIDANILYQVFVRRPDWSFVFIGDRRGKSKQWSALNSLPNAHFLGPRKLAELPGYLKHVDVGLMPYIMTDKILIADSPLKLYEYLATGKPVVTVPLPSLSHLKPVVRFANDADEWEAAIEDALNEKAEYMIEQRQLIASQNTWDHRIALISELIEKELKTKVKHRGAKETALETSSS